MVQTFAKLADKYAERPFSYLWAEGGAQPQLESLLEVGGYVDRNQPTKLVEDNVLRLFP